MIYPKTSKNAKRDERRREKKKSGRVRISPRMKKKYKKYTTKKKRKCVSVKEQTCDVTPTRKDAKRVTRYQSKAATKIQAVVRGRIGRLVFREIRLKDIRFKFFTIISLNFAFRVGGLLQAVNTFYNFVSNPHCKTVNSGLLRPTFERYKTVLEILRTESKATERRIHSSGVNLETDTLIKFYEAKDQICDMLIIMHKCWSFLEDSMHPTPSGNNCTRPVLTRHIANDFEPYPYFGM
jgi:hypothetical protein